MRAPTNSVVRLDEVLDRPALRRVIHDCFCAAGVSTATISASAGTEAGSGAAAGAIGAADATSIATGSGADSGNALGATSCGSEAGSGCGGFFLKKLNIGNEVRTAVGAPGPWRAGRYNRRILTEREMMKLRIKTLLA